MTDRTCLITIKNHKHHPRQLESSTLKLIPNVVSTKVNTAQFAVRRLAQLPFAVILVEKPVATASVAGLPPEFLLDL